MASAPFHFKKFSVFQEGVTHAVGTDGVLLGAWADVAGATRILDIGTGTGLIALMLAQRTEPSVGITALDLHPDSVVCARQNAANSPWQDRVVVLETAVQDFAATSGQTFDLIVSNPPFFSDLTISPDATRSLGRHMTSLSIGDLLESILHLLAPAGKCCLILPEREGKLLCEMAVPLGLYCSREVQVRARAGKPVERLLLQLERDPGHFKREELAIYGAQNTYSTEYKQLTTDFYLNK